MKGLAFLIGLEHELLDETIQRRAKRRELKLNRFARTVREIVKDDRRLSQVWDRAIDDMPDNYSAADLMRALQKLEHELVRRRDVCRSVHGILLPILKRGLTSHQSS